MFMYLSLLFVINYLFCCCNSKITEESSVFLSKYLFYDVNPPEGFNLRRDVFMRLAIFIKSLKADLSHWHLVLPPWPHLFHWKSYEQIGFHNLIPWREFFDVAGMKRYTEVVEMYEVLNEIRKPTLDITLVLQNYEDAYTDSWTWEDKWEFAKCNRDSTSLYKKVGDNYDGYFWGYGNITSRDLFCVSFQGQASKLKELINSVDRRLIMIDHAEIVLHDFFGDPEYWRCRRSMRFASHLVEAAAEFRKQYLNSTDESDNTVRPDKWEDEIVHRNAVGGQYLSIHLRRQDFELSRKDEIPTLKQAAEQISKQLEILGLTKVFIATDAPPKFMEKLRDKLKNYKVIEFPKHLNNKKKFKDGGLAIIDQIICSHARYFIGTYESTFSFRIQEEREILGFPIDTTFNRLCGSINPCTEPTKWIITH